MLFIDQLFLYQTFRSGRLLTVIHTRLPLWLCWFNPWACYAKAASHGAVGDLETAKRYCRCLFFFYPFRYIKDELIKYLGVTQPELTDWIISKGVDKKLLAAYELVNHGVSGAFEKGNEPTADSHLGALMLNRTKSLGPDRVDSIRQFLKKDPEIQIEWCTDSPFKVQFEKPSMVSAGVTCTHKVSILVTAYNCEEYIQHSIRSLLDQTYSNIEILVANDASTDGTRAHLNQLENIDSRLKIFNLPENIGTYAAKSLMLEFAEGEYLVCHDADDLASPFFIEKSLWALKQDAAKIAAISEWFRVDEELRIFPGAVRRFWPILSMNHSSLMLRKSILKQLGGWDVPRVAADTEIYERIKVAFGSDSIVHLKEALTIGSFREGSLMNNPQVGAIKNESFLRRITYREAWLNWHQCCKRNGSNPVMPSPFDANRPFDVPAELRVDPEAIKRCFVHIGEQPS